MSGWQLGGRSSERKAGPSDFNSRARPVDLDEPGVVVVVGRQIGRQGETAGPRLPGQTDLTD